MFRGTLMRKLLILAFVPLFILAFPHPIFGQANMSGVVVFSQPGFPAADTVSPSSQQMGAIFSGARLAAADQLREALASPSSRVLVLPYGSAFPEQAWPEIKSFLNRGGNLVALGGMPFTRAAYLDSNGWHLRDYSVRFIRPLMIDQYQETPGLDG